MNFNTSMSRLQEGKSKHWQEVRETNFICTVCLKPTGSAFSPAVLCTSRRLVRYSFALKQRWHYGFSSEKLIPTHKQNLLPGLRLVDKRLCCCGALLILVLQTHSDLSARLEPLIPKKYCKSYLKRGSMKDNLLKYLVWLFSPVFTNGI